jgi:23S rRNA pseudouridine1911/1915/1917 synthase
MFKLQREILFEDNHIIIVNKQNSDLVQSDETGDESLLERLKKFIKDKYNKPGNVFLGLVHRLDRPTSGAVIFAKTSKALSRMNNLIKNREITKTYLAIVENAPLKNADTLIHYLKKNQKQNKSYSRPKSDKNAKKAILEYRVVAASKNYFLLEVELQTGRHHQIRAQLAEINCPIKGDVKYGAKRNNPDYSIDLHAYKLSFIHPVSNENISVKAKPPSSNIWNYFEEYLEG